MDMYLYIDMNHDISLMRRILVYPEEDVDSVTESVLPRPTQDPI